MVEEVHLLGVEHDAREAGGRLRGCLPLRVQVDPGLAHAEHLHRGGRACEPDVPKTVAIDRLVGLVVKAASTLQAVSGAVAVL